MLGGFRIRVCVSQMVPRMSEENQKYEFESQQKPRKDAINVLDFLLTVAGFDAGDLQIALEAIKQAKEHSLQPKQDDGEYRIPFRRIAFHESKRTHFSGGI